MPAVSVAPGTAHADTVRSDTGCSGAARFDAVGAGPGAPSAAPAPRPEAPVAGPGPERGAGLVEYALLVGLIVLVCVAAITLLGGTTAAKYSSMASLFPN